jgi:hypothetical protein
MPKGINGSLVSLAILFNFREFQQRSKGLFKRCNRITVAVAKDVIIKRELR